MSQQLANSEEVQISTSDPESRQLITRNNITEVAYNVQTVVDAKHNLPIDYKVTNQNDSKAMSGMLRRTKTILGTTDFTVGKDVLKKFLKELALLFYRILASIKAIIFKIRTSIFSKRSTKILLYAPLNRFQLIYI
jgi:hypothetical protein